MQFNNTQDYINVIEQPVKVSYSPISNIDSNMNLISPYDAYKGTTYSYGESSYYPKNDTLYSSTVRPAGGLNPIDIGQSPLYKSSYDKSYNYIKKIPQQYSSLRQTFDTRSDNRIKELMAKLQKDDMSNKYDPKKNYNKYDTSYDNSNDRKKQKTQFRNYQLQDKLKKYSTKVDQFSAQLQLTKKMSMQIRKLKEDRKKRLDALQRQNQQYQLSNSLSTADITKQSFSKSYDYDKFLKPQQEQAYNFKRKKSYNFNTPYTPQLERKKVESSYPVRNYYNFDHQKNYKDVNYNQKQLKKQLESYEQKYKYKESGNTTLSSQPSYQKTLKTLLNKKEQSFEYIEVNNFILGKTLGQGKFGVVYRAVHKPTGWLFAIKKVPKQMIKSHLMIDQFILELKLQAFLNHEYILTLYTQFDDKDSIYLVLEYMEQGTLFSHLKKNKTLSQQQTACKIKQIASAVKYLHQNVIAHRDIKPENIVMSHGVCKLCDFGWATICDQRRKTYCGTFDYAPPQILQGHEYDYTVDLWCLGVLTYELLVGKAPFYHISRKQTMKKILNVENISIQYPKNLSKTAISFIQKLIRRDPNQRLSSQLLLEHQFLKYSQKKVMDKY